MMKVSAIIDSRASSPAPTQLTAGKYRPSTWYMTPKMMKANRVTPIVISMPERTRMNTGSGGTPWLSFGVV